VKRRFVRWFDRGGWTCEGALPLPPKAVIMGGPHTSNFDFLIFVGALETMGVEASYVGKASLFRWRRDGALNERAGRHLGRALGP
jgi:1-acyl-sn-glycerol-3-phosphate acyltransferase